jgi:hypothetical protein
VTALNYNGEGPRSEAATLHICLPPADFPAPEYLSSTSTTLTVKWCAPRALNGCPLYKYQLFRDTGAGDAIATQEGGDILPHVTTHTLTFSAGDTATAYRVELLAFNEAGSVRSGTGAFLLADIPESPQAPVSVASETSDQRIKVAFLAPLPGNRGSPITSVQLAMDDGLGGAFQTVLGADETAFTLHTSYAAEQGIVKGRGYRFRCRARNAIGWSAWSPDAYITAAALPA